MHFLAIPLLTILAGTLLLAKFKKEQAGKLFTCISWFFIVVGVILFLGVIGRGIVGMRHHGYTHKPTYRSEMMMKNWHHRMYCRCCRCPKHMEENSGIVVEVPALIKEAFTKMFPSAMDVKYEMEGKDYEIKIKDKGVEMSANFDASGKWLETETEIKISDLPNDVSASVAKSFVGFKISEIAKVETPDKGVGYEMDLNNGKEGYEVQFSPKGDILNKQPLKKEKEEEENENQ